MTASKIVISPAGEFDAVWPTLDKIEPEWRRNCVLCGEDQNTIASTQAI